VHKLSFSIYRSVFVSGILIVLTALLPGCSPVGESVPGTDEVERSIDATDSATIDAARVARVHDDLIAIDTHIDIPEVFATSEFDPGVINQDRQVDLPRMRDGGLHVGFFVVYMPQTQRNEENYATAVQQARAKFDSIHRMTNDMYPEQIELAYSVDDVLRIRNEGKLVAMIGIENGYGIGPDLSLLQEYADLGARYITLAHIGHNDIADSSMPRADLNDSEQEHGGISAFGRKVVAKMNRVGIAVDVSHISRDAMLQATSLSEAAVMASHSGVSAIFDHPRNLDDRQLLALQENGGVIQLVAFDSYLRAVPEEKKLALGRLYEELGIGGPREVRTLQPEMRGRYDSKVAEIHKRWPRASVSTLIDHLDHAVRTIGVDHVGLSSDFQGGGGIDGWDDASQTMNVTAELLRRGYSEDEVRKIWGGNLLRVMRDVEQVALSYSVSKIE
jgi:membrane dipeptidase